MRKYFRFLQNKKLYIPHHKSDKQCHLYEFQLFKLSFMLLKLKCELMQTLGKNPIEL